MARSGSPFRSAVLPAALLVLCASVVAGPRALADGVADEVAADVAGALQEAREARARGDHPGALAHAERAYGAARTPRERRDSLRYLLILQITGHRWHAAHRLIPTLRLLEQGLGNAHGVAACDVQMASVEASLGRLPAALARIEDAIAFFDARGAAYERRGAHLNAAKIRLELRDPGRAREHLQQARTAGAGLRLSEAPLWMLEGALGLAEGRPGEAAEAFRRAVPWLAEAPAESRAAAHVGRAVALSAGGDSVGAKQEIARARQVLEGRPPSLARAQVASTECLVRLEAGDVPGAVAAGLEARRLVPEGLSDPSTLLLEARLARAYLALGEPVAALEASGRAAAASLAISGVLPAATGMKQRGEFADVFALGVDAAAEIGDLRSLFRLAEQARAVALRARIGNETLVEHGVPQDLRAEDLRLAEAEAAALEDYRSAVGRGPPDGVRRAFASLDEARRARERHQERIAARKALVGHVLLPRVDDLEQAQRGLAPSEALVVLASGRSALHAVVILPESVRRVGLGVPSDLERLVRDHVVEDVASPGDEALAALARGLVAPLDLPAQATRVAIVPTGALALVPFAALMPDRDVVLLPSVTVGRMLGERPAAPPEARILAAGVAEGAFGRALPRAESEARGVGDLVLVGAGATEGAVREAAAGGPWRGLHLACHALIDTDRPMRSALVLRSSPGQDGLWSVGEILSDAARADLVVLSACSSGVGHGSDAEGGLGLVHSFLVAGARAVLATAWEVEDAAAAEVMRRFHAASVAGADPPAALRSAQASLRAEPRFRHPAHWAGWQVWGSR